MNIFAGVYLAKGVGLCEHADNSLAHEQGILILCILSHAFVEVHASKLITNEDMDGRFCLCDLENVRRLSHTVVELHARKLVITQVMEDLARVSQGETRMSGCVTSLRAHEQASTPFLEA